MIKNHEWPNFYKKSSLKSKNKLQTFREYIVKNQILYFGWKKRNQKFRKSSKGIKMDFKKCNGIQKTKLDYFWFYDVWRHLRWGTFEKVGAFSGDLNGKQTNIFERRYFFVFVYYIIKPIR